MLHNQCGNDGRRKRNRKRRRKRSYGGGHKLQKALKGINESQQLELSMCRQRTVLRNELTARIETSEEQAEQTTHNNNNFISPLTTSANDYAMRKQQSPQLGILRNIPPVGYKNTSEQNYLTIAIYVTLSEQGRYLGMYATDC